MPWFIWCLPVAFGTLGAVCSWSARTSSSPLILGAYILNIILAGSSWMYIVRSGAGSLVRLSGLWDVLYAVAYFSMFICLGERVAPVQGLGLVLILLGMYLLG